MASIVAELGRGRRPVKELVSRVGGSEEAVLSAVRQLLAEGCIVVTGEDGELALRE